MTDTDLAVVMTAHSHGPGDACPECGESWPCLISVLLERIEKAKAALGYFGYQADHIIHILEGNDGSNHL